jgi:hypothetical protein
MTTYCNRDHPIATLRQALAMVRGEMPAMNTEVLMAPGVYYNQDVVWTHTNPVYAITFKPLVEGSTVVFDGCASGSNDYANDCPDHTAHGDGDGHFFLLGNHSPGDTSLRFEHLEIRHYRNGIRFTNGARARNRIAHCYFHHIGIGWAPNLSYASAPGYGAVRSRNSSYNEFVGNRFSHIENVSGTCDVCAGHMHSYYLSDSSDHNTFDNETHEYVSGGPIRFRNYSNHNVVKTALSLQAGSIRARSATSTAKPAVSVPAMTFSSRATRCTAIGIAPPRRRCGSPTWRRAAARNPLSARGPAAPGTAARPARPTARRRTRVGRSP